MTFMARCIVLLFALLVLTGCSPSRAIEAFRVLGDVAAGAGPSALKEHTTRPTRETIRYSYEGETFVADLYRPGSAPAKAVTILVPGVVPEGKDDDRLVAFANTMARARFMVFVPDLPNLKNLNVSSQDAEALSKAARYIASRSGVGEDASVGFIAFSYAAGPALLAALSEEARQSIRFVYAVGPYYDIEAVTTYLTAGFYRKAGRDRWLKASPSPYAKWVFAHSNASRIDDPDDRRLLTDLAERKLQDPDAQVRDIIDDLGQEGRTVYALLVNTDPDLTADLVADLPPPVLSEFRALDLKGKSLEDLEARLILIHGRDDTLIPYTESVALASAVKNGRVELFIIDHLEHVELQLKGMVDLYKLWRATYILLSERDRMPVPVED